jgi:hypothetical protein
MGMDIRRKLAVTLAAMALAGQLGAPLPATAASRTQLSIMQAYLAADDPSGLADYIDQNPELLEQGSPLSSLLMDFMRVYRGQARLVAFPPQTVASLKAPLVTALRAAMY